MTKLAIGICLLYLLTLSASAQGSPSSAMPAGDATPRCDDVVTRACRAAADELAAARKLIEAQTAQIRAGEDRLKIETDRLGLLAEKNQALLEQVEALRQQLEAERAARAQVAIERDAEREKASRAALAVRQGRKRTLLALGIGAALGALAAK